MSSTAELITDEQLFTRLNQHDVSGLEVLFKRYYKPLWRFAKDMLGDSDQAEDAVQEVFGKIWEKRGSIYISSTVKGYLYTAVRNNCLNLIKTNARKNFLEEGMEDDSRFSVEDVQAKLAAKTMQQKINTALELLPPKCGIIFKMSRFEDKSYKEIAEDLGLSVKTVENQMGKALQLMRTYLQPYMKELYTMIIFTSGLFNLI